ncbi:MAG: Uncharacterised protein [Glaciecola sp. HTCC2999]|jgi:hypothetical protein|nr:MAG: Uncharacterised protein [Glaciecola sp. HTCC2999]
MLVMTFIDVLILLVAPVLAFIIGIIVVSSWQLMPRNLIYTVQYYVTKMSHIF